MMSVVVILVLLETVRFLIKDKSETLSSKYVLPDIPDFTKIENVFEKSAIRQSLFNK